MSNQRSKKQEKKIAKAINGKEVPASGALPFWKNDVYSRFWQVEGKYTDRASFSIKRQYLEQLVIEAHKNWRLPALVVEFSPKEIYVVITWNEWLHYNSLLEEEYAEEP